MIKKLVIGVFSLFILFAFFIVIHLNQDLYDSALGSLPNDLRRNYIEYMLDDSDDVSVSNHIKVVLLTSLYKKGYDFDVRLLYPLSNRNSAIYNEPVPQLAVKVIHKHYADSTSDLLNYYKDDPLNRKLIENQLQKLK